MQVFSALENAKSNGIFDFIENDLVFDNDSTNKIKMNHIKTMLCGHFIGIDKLERLKLLQNDPSSTSLIKGRLLTPVQGEPVWVADKTQSFNAWWR